MNFFALSSKMQIALVAAVVLSASLITLSFLIKNRSEDRWINLACIALGLTLGWLFGTYVSPYGKGEELRFTEYAAAVSAFVSGYLIAKIDALITALFRPEFVLQPVVGFRVIATLCTFVISLLVTYMGRVYV